MNGYLLCVIGTVLVCSILTAIAPEGRTLAVIKGVARLVCVLAIIAPVLTFFKTGELAVFSDKNRQDFFSEDGIQTQESFIQYYSEMRISQTEIALQEEMEEKYKVFSTITLSWSQFEGEIRIDKIQIKLLKPTDEEVKRAVCEYLTNNYCSEVLIE